MAHRNLNLSASVLLRIEELFKEKEWSLNLGSTSLSLYTRFCQRLSLFDNAGQNFLIELSKSFDVISFTTHIETFWLGFLNIPQAILRNANKIYFMPLIDINPPKSGKTKSSQALHYYIRSSDVDWIDFNEKFYFPSSESELSELFNKESVLILVDDFVGSGETACQSVMSYTNQVDGLSSDNLIIVTLAAQEIGIENAKIQTGCATFSDRIYKRGITDCSPSHLLNEHLSLMIDMESKVSKLIKAHGFSLGYSQSEATVSLGDKTPNNTFPVFWYETKGRKSPFPRYRHSKPGL